MSEKKYAIHTVFIAKENILFLEQWIDYHMLLGFNLFFYMIIQKSKKLEENII